MAATNQQRYEGLLDLLIKDEQERAKMRELANRVGAAASTLQQFNVAQRMPMAMGGGLLQQPTHPVMTSAGTGMTGMQPIDNEGEKFAKIRAFLGI